MKESSLGSFLDSRLWSEFVGDDFSAFNIGLRLSTGDEISDADVASFNTKIVVIQKIHLIGMLTSDWESFWWS